MGTVQVLIKRNQGARYPLYINIKKAGVGTVLRITGLALHGQKMKTPKPRQSPIATALIKKKTLYQYQRLRPISDPQGVLYKFL